MRFQRKVSLTWCRGSSGDDRDTTDRTDSNHRAGCCLRRGERAGGVPAAGPGRCLRLRGADVDAARLPGAGQAVEGAGEALPGEDHRLLARPADAAHPPAPRDGAGGRPPGRQPGAALRARVHAGRHPPAGPGGRGPGPDVRARDAGGAAPRVPCLRRRALRAPRRDLREPHLQPAGFADLSDATHGGPGDEGNGGDSGRAPRAATGRLARLPARRHCPSGRPRRRQGRVPDQRCRRGDAVRVRRCRRGDLGALPGAGTRRPARPVPVRRCRLPCGQRLRVRQPHRGRAAQQAARPGLHQVAPAALYRQRPRRGQERQRRAPLPRPRPHPAALRAAGRYVHAAAPVAVSQLPPAVPVRHRARGRQRPHPPRLPGCPTCRRPTTSCAPCRTPKPVSSLVSRSHNSTPRPMRTATCRPPERSTPSATACSRPSPKPGPRSPETQHPRDPAPRFPPPAHRRFTV